MRRFLTVLCLLSGFTFSGRASGVELRSKRPPPVDPMSFFTGHTRSSGVFENRRGDPVKTVRTETRGRLVNGELLLEQDLFIAGQPRQHRSWKLRRIDARHFEGAANDIIGIAHGRLQGNTFSWSFTLATKVGNPLFNVRMSQHMYFQDDGRTMINRSSIRKFGVLITGVSEQFRRE